MATVCQTCNTSSQDTICSSCPLRLSKIQSILTQATSQIPLSGLAETVVDEHYSDIIRNIDLRCQHMILAISDYSATLVDLVEQQKQDVMKNNFPVSLTRQIVQKNLSRHLKLLLESDGDDLYKIAPVDATFLSTTLPPLDRLNLLEQMSTTLATHGKSIKFTHQKEDTPSVFGNLTTSAPQLADAPFALSGHTETVCLVVSDGDDIIASHSDYGKGISIWSVSARKRLRVLAGDRNLSYLFSMEIHGKYLASLLQHKRTEFYSSSYQSLLVWNIVTGELLYSERTSDVTDGFYDSRYPCENDHMCSVNFTGEGLLAVCITNGVLLIDVSNSPDSCPKRLIASYHPSFVAFNGYGTMAVCERFSAIKLFDVATGQSIETETFLKPNYGNCSALVFSGKDHLICGYTSEDETVKKIILVDIAAFAVIRTFDEPNNVYRLASNGLGMLASCNNRGGISVWDINTGERLRTITGVGSGYLCFCNYTHTLIASRIDSQKSPLDIYIWPLV